MISSRTNCLSGYRLGVLKQFYTWHRGVLTWRNPMNAPKMTEAQQTAVRSVEKSLKLRRSVQTLEGTDKDGVEHLLEMALENLQATK